MIECNSIIFLVTFFQDLTEWVHLHLKSTVRYFDRSRWSTFCVYVCVFAKYFLCVKISTVPVPARVAVPASTINLHKQSVEQNKEISKYYVQNLSGTVPYVRWWYNAKIIHMWYNIYREVRKEIFSVLFITNKNSIKIKRKLKKNRSLKLSSKNN